MDVNKIYCGDALEVLKTFPSESIDMVITSPPYYGLRDYGVEGQIGLEKTFEEYLDNLIIIFNEVKRVLKPGGTCWVNLGDTYFGGGNNRGNTKEISLKQKSNKGATGQVNIEWDFTKYQAKSLLQIPSRFGIAMTDNGWILRNEIIWHKPNCMPSSVNDRFTVDYEKLFFFTKNKKYYFEQQKEPMKTTNPPRGRKGVIGQVNLGLRKQDLIGRSDYTGFNDRYNPPNDLMRNKRSVWSINTKPLKETHFATFPEELIEIPIKAGCPENGIVLDIFIGSGTTGMVAKKLNRNYIGIDLKEDYCKLARKRINRVYYQMKLDLETVRN